ncbi:MAG: hypothetical protein CMM93_01365, partial [Rickettsiales bacterium]|nr:hypothetical protein [Rickettsiales bacterium]
MHHKLAFSLVELSIVLVILGLLTGGILTGQSLIRAAELRSVGTQFQSFHTAVQSFRDKYFALPGDMRNATTFWGSAGGSGTLGDGCQTATGTGTQTCNGDGNGRIASNPFAAGTYAEIFTFWQHLSNAGLIEGTYTGKAGSVSLQDHDFGINAPAAKLGNMGWGSSWINNEPDTISYVWTLDYSSWMSIGADNNIYAGQAKAMTPQEAWNLDQKFDDGLPGLGRVHGTSITCSDQTDNANWKIAKYLL